MSLRKGHTTIHKPITAIFLDVGNTLRILTKNETHQSLAREKIVNLLGIDEDPDIFCKKLDERYKVYRKWAFENMKEASETELWARWLTPEIPFEKIAPISVELTYQYRQSMGLRVMVENGKKVLIELHRRGYKLGLISNVITSREIPDWLEEDGLSDFFDSVMLSSVSGLRKPDPQIYLQAASKAGVNPEECVYVGDNLKRDVTGTRQAGFGLVVIMTDPEVLAQNLITEENRPDVIIHEFIDLLEIFPGSPIVNLERVQQTER